MKVFKMKSLAMVTAGLLGVALLAMPARTWAQASIHGHAQNPVGQALSSGEVRLTSDTNPGAPNLKYDYTFPVDADGNYKGTPIKPGSYFAILFQGDKHVDYLPVHVSAGEDKTLDFDMTRKDYIDKMTPEERASVEAFKKKNAGVAAENSKILNLNGMLTAARAQIQAGSYDQPAKDMAAAAAQKPDEAILWDTLGDAQLGQADTAAKAARAAKTTDPAVPEMYTAAGVSYQKALTVNAASKKPNAGLAAAANNQLGLIDSKTGKMKEASAAYDAAAVADPTKAGVYYYNEAASLFNANDAADAATAADKAIAADPTKVEAYYIKAQGLAPAITGPVNGKFVAPPGLVEACNKYLELAPTGPHAQDMKDLLTGLGETVQTSYKSSKKK